MKILLVIDLVVLAILCYTLFSGKAQNDEQKSVVERKDANTKPQKRKTNKR